MVSFPLLLLLTFSAAPAPAPSTAAVVAASVAVGAGSAVANVAGLAVALQGGARFPPLIAAGPVLGVAGAGVGGGLAQGLVDEPDPVVGAAWAAGGALVVGAGAAAVAFVWAMRRRTTRPCSRRALAHWALAPWAPPWGLASAPPSPCSRGSRRQISRDMNNGARHLAIMTRESYRYDSRVIWR